MPRGQLLNYGGTGAFPLFGHVNHKFALADMQINDRFGNAAGRFMLQHVANVLRQHAGDNDFIARWAETSSLFSHGSGQ